MFQVSWQDTFQGSYDWHSLVHTSFFEFMKLVWFRRHHNIFVLEGRLDRRPTYSCKRREFICCSVSGEWEFWWSYFKHVAFLLVFLSHYSTFFLDFRDPCILLSSEARQHIILMEVTVICFSSSGNKVFPNQMNAVIQRKNICLLVAITKSQKNISLFFLSHPPLVMRMWPHTTPCTSTLHSQNLCKRQLHLKRIAVRRLVIEEMPLLCMNQFQMIVWVPFGHEWL